MSNEDFLFLLRGKEEGRSKNISYTHETVTMNNREREKEREREREREMREIKRFFPMLFCRKYVPESRASIGNFHQNK